MAHTGSGCRRSLPCPCKVSLAPCAKESRGNNRERGQEWRKPIRREREEKRVKEKAEIRDEDGEEPSLFVCVCVSACVCVERGGEGERESERECAQ